MNKIGIFFGSSSGATQDVAQLIQSAFGPDAELVNVKRARLEDLERYDLLILGSPTYEEGRLQKHWYAFHKKMRKADLSGKTVAVFALGDQRKYKSSFADALDPLASRARECGAKLIGEWPIDGYDFKGSRGLRDGHFLGLVIDDDCQRELTPERIEGWVANLKAEFGVPVDK